MTWLNGLTVTKFSCHSSPQSQLGKVNNWSNALYHCERIYCNYSISMHCVFVHHSLLYLPNWNYKWFYFLCGTWNSWKVITVFYVWFQFSANNTFCSQVAVLLSFLKYTTEFSEKHYSIFRNTKALGGIYISSQRLSYMRSRHMIKMKMIYLYIPFNLRIIYSI